MAFHTCSNQTKTKASIKNKTQIFSDHPSPNERWLHGVSLVHMPNGGGILNTFVFICGKVSLILSFCRANVSRTSSKILGHITAVPEICRNHTLPQLVLGSITIYGACLCFSEEAKLPPAKVELPSLRLLQNMRRWPEENLITFYLVAFSIVRLPPLSLQHIFPHARCLEK